MDENVVQKDVAQAKAWYQWVVDWHQRVADWVSLNPKKSMWLWLAVVIGVKLV